MSTQRIHVSDLDLNLPTDLRSGRRPRARRVPVRLQLWLSDALSADGEEFAAWAYNASASGLAVSVPSNTTFRQGEQVRVRCHELIDAYASVVWIGGVGVNHRGEPSTMIGLEFLANQNLSALAQYIAGHRPSVLLVTNNSENTELVSQGLGAKYELLEAYSQEGALRVIDEREVAVLILDPLTSGLSARKLLREIDVRFPNINLVRIMLSDYTDSETILGFVREQGVFYFLQKPSAPETLAAVVHGAMDEYFSKLRNSEVASQPREGSTAQRVLEHSRRLAIQRDLPSAAQAATEAIFDLLEAVRAYCHVFEPRSQTLWYRAKDGEEHHHPVAIGLTGFVARTGAPLNLPHAGDARYDPAADDPDGGTGAEPFLAVAIRSPDRRTLAVLSAVRDAGDEPFSAVDLEALAALASHTASAFSQAQLQANVDTRANGPAPVPSHYRADAYQETYGSVGTGQGEVLRVSPRWTRGVYWVILGLFVSAILFGVFGRISEVTHGPTVIMAENQTTLTARAAGTVSRVLIQPGAQVEEGQRLVELYAAEEEANLARIDKEFRLQLARSLQNPTDESARGDLAKLRTQRDLARAKLEELIVRAPRAGTISDVRVRGGQVVSPGTPLVSFMDNDSRYYLIAMINGELRPMLRAGMPLKLELQGYKYAYTTVYIESVSKEVLGPQEARGYLGNSLADSMDITQPVAIVRASLRGKTFKARGEQLTLHPGMLGTAEIKLRSRRVFAALLPGLSEL